MRSSHPLFQTLSRVTELGFVLLVQLSVVPYSQHPHAGFAAYAQSTARLRWALCSGTLSILLTYGAAVPEHC